VNSLYVLPYHSFVVDLNLIAPGRNGRRTERLNSCHCSSSTQRPRKFDCFCHGLADRMSGCSPDCNVCSYMRSLLSALLNFLGDVKEERRKLDKHEPCEIAVRQIKFIHSFMTSSSREKIIFFSSFHF
jgi:hypothetical protein